MANKKIGNEDIFEGNILVDIIAKATELEAKLKDQLKTFKDLAKNNPFKNGEDLKKFNDTMKEIDASASLLEETQKQNKKATEELNKELAKEVAASKEIKDIIDDVNGTLDQNIKLQTQRKTQIQDLRKDQAELNKLYKIGAISQSKFTNESAKLSKEIQELSIANSKLGFTIKAQIKEGQAASTSFDQQAQRLGQLKSAYRKLTEEERENVEVGGVLLKSIESLDKQVKANDASIGNFQRNVGNYKEGVKDAIKETGVFDGVIRRIAQAQALYAAAQKTTAAATGKSTGALKLFKIALISTGVGAIVVALGSLIALLSKTQAGIEFTTKAFAGIGAAIDVVVDRFSSVGSALVNLFKGDFKAAAEDFGEATKDITKEIVEETKAAIKLKEALIDIEKAENDLILQRAATRRDVKELNKIAEDTTKTDEERAAAARKAIAIEQTLLNKQVETQKQRAANLLGVFELTEERLEDIRKNGLDINDVGFANSTEEERKEAIEAIAEIFALQESSLELQTTLNNKLNVIEQQRLAKQKKAQEEAAKQREKFEKEQFDKRITIEKIQTKTTQDLANEVAEQDKKNKKEQAKRDKEANDKYIAGKIETIEKEKAIEESNAKAAKERREKQLDLATDFTSQVGEKLSQVSERETELLDRQAEQTQSNIEKQTRLAEAGLDNQLAFETQKAAEIEIKRQEAAEKEERRQKTQLFLESTLQFLKEGSPLEAVGKAAALVTGADLIAGNFYEGSDLVEKDLGKPQFKGRDGYMIRVDGKERIFNPSQNMRIRSALGDISNEDLVERAIGSETRVVNKFNDGRIVQGLQSVEREIQNIKVELNIDEKGVISQSQFKDGLKRVQKQAKRPRGGINP